MSSDAHRPALVQRSCSHLSGKGVEDVTQSATLANLWYGFGAVDVMFNPLGVAVI